MEVEVLDKVSRLSPIYDDWNKILKVFAQTFIQILVQPLNLRKEKQANNCFRILCERSENQWNVSN